MSLALAERMMAKAAADGKVDTEDGLWLYIRVCGYCG
jgi:hypothetical protein